VHSLLSQSKKRQHTIASKINTSSRPNVFLNTVLVNTLKTIKHDKIEYKVIFKITFAYPRVTGFM